MKIISIVGTRPQFIKLAPLSHYLREMEHEELILHTGQHYDKNMSRTFFDALNIPEPDYNLGVGSGTHAVQTAKMLEGIEHLLLDEQPALAILFGDTNSTLAGALAATKIHIPIAHMEAGLRSFNRKMPEEINRILTDQVSRFLFCPTPASVTNLANEGIEKGVYLAGDLMYEALKNNISIAHERSNILEKLHLKGHDFCLLTLHRAENTDSEERMSGILAAVCSLDTKTIFPAHPRTQKYIKQYKLTQLVNDSNITLIDPIDYLDMLSLTDNAKVLFTDSGGMQKEALWLQTPCVTLRDETEWVELIALGANTLAGADKDTITDAYQKMINIAPATVPEYYKFKFHYLKEVCEQVSV